MHGPAGRKAIRWLVDHRRRTDRRREMEESPSREPPLRVTVGRRQARLEELPLRQVRVTEATTEDADGRETVDLQEVIRQVVTTVRVDRDVAVTAGTIADLT